MDEPDQPRGSPRYPLDPAAAFRDGFASGAQPTRQAGTSQANRAVRKIPRLVAVAVRCATCAGSFSNPVEVTSHAVLFLAS